MSSPPLHGPEHPIPVCHLPSPSPPPLSPTCSESLPTKERYQKAQFCILGGSYCFPSWSRQLPKSPPKCWVFDHARVHKPSCRQTHHLSPTIHKISLLSFGGVAPLARITGLGDALNIPVTLFQFSPGLVRGWRTNGVEDGGASISVKCFLSVLWPPFSTAFWLSGPCFGFDFGFGKGRSFLLQANTFRGHQPQIQNNLEPVLEQDRNRFFMRMTQQVKLRTLSTTKMIKESSFLASK